MNVYFESTGKEHTQECLKRAGMAASQEEIEEFVVATTTGHTALKAAEMLDGKIVAVTHSTGFRKDWENQLSPETRKKIEEKGIHVVTATHALSGVERALSNKSQGMYPLETIANTLRIFGQGTKVCVECVVMAADAGALSGKPVMAIGGTGRGADTALIISPAHGKDLFNMKVNKVVCKPSLLAE